MSNRVTITREISLASNWETVLKDFDTRGDRVKSEIDIGVQELSKNPPSSIDESKSKISKLISDAMDRNGFPKLSPEEKALILQK
jgi:hypothetical protein